MPRCRFVQRPPPVVTADTGLGFLCTTERFLQAAPAEANRRHYRSFKRIIRPKIVPAVPISCRSINAGRTVDPLFHQPRQHPPTGKIRGGKTMMKRLKMNPARLIAWVLAVLLAPCAAGNLAAAPPAMDQIQTAESARELLDIYSGSENAIVRQRAIQALGDVVGGGRFQGLAKARPDAGDADTAAALLRQGLSDPSLSVVRESVRQIGDLHLAAFAFDLADMFYEADRRFPGSQKEIQAEIITALGKIDGAAARDVFGTVLDQGMANYRSQKVLDAVAAMNDPSMAAAVAAYADDLETVLLAMPDTPENRFPRMRYRRALAHARRVQQQLSGQ
jgi:hypothetical protein